MLAGWLALLLVLGFSACAGRTDLPADGNGPSTPPAAVQRGLPRLPLPSELAGSARGASVGDSNRWYSGDYFDSNRPNALVAQEFLADLPPDSGKFDRAVFSPNWEQATASSPAGVAYALYNFDALTDFDGPTRIYGRWIAGRPDDIWYALANFGRDRWDWYHSADGYSIDVAAMAPYIDATKQAYLCVAALGTQPMRLEYVLLGDSVLDVFDWNTDLPSNPLARVAPLPVNFTTASEYLLVGSDTLELYEMDFEGDGTYDDSDATSGAFQHTYNPGDYTPTLRVTDDTGTSYARSFPLLVIDPNNANPTAAFTPSVATGPAPLAVDFDAGASADADGSITKYEWDWESDGTYDFASADPQASHGFAVHGVNSVTLRVTDNNLATATFSSDITLTTGWRRTAAIADADILAHLSAKVQGTGANARICVAWQDSDSYHLRFARSTNPLGTAWDAPVTAIAGSSQLQHGFTPSLIIESLTASPAVASVLYDTASSSRSLLYTRALNAGGTAWSLPTTVDTLTSLSRPELGQFGTKLTIAVVEREGYSTGSELRIYQATNATGTLWGAPQVLPTPAGYEGVSRPRLLAVPGQNPLVMCCGPTTTFTTHPLLANAAAADGSSWGALAALPEPGTQNDGVFSLAMAGGRPALAVGGASSNGVLRFRRADDAAGTGWSTPFSVLDQRENGNVGEWTSFASIGGAPAVAYSVSTQLRFVMATDSSGSAWGAVQIVENSGNTGAGCQLLNLDAVPVIVYTDRTNDAIKTACFY